LTIPSVLVYKMSALAQTLLSMQTQHKFSMKDNKSVKR